MTKKCSECGCSKTKCDAHIKRQIEWHEVRHDDIGVIKLHSLGCCPECSHKARGGK